MTALKRVIDALNAAVLKIARAFGDWARCVVLAFKRAAKRYHRWHRRHVVRDLPSHHPQWRRAAKGIDYRMFSKKRRMAFARSNL